MTHFTILLLFKVPTTHYHYDIKIIYSTKHYFIKIMDEMFLNYKIFNVFEILIVIQ